jgi:hypothetical protein
MKQLEKYWKRIQNTIRSRKEGAVLLSVESEEEERNFILSKRKSKIT